MGNEIVIPASNNWYSSILAKHGYKIRKQVDCGNFFLKFDGYRDDSNSKEIYYIKAFQYDKPLSEVQNYSKIVNYFDIIKENKYPGIFSYSDIIQTENEVFFIRKKFGQTLYDLITFKDPPMTEEEKFFITYQLLLAVNEFRTLGIAHGDLKPNNIILNESNQVFIVDPAPFKPKFLDFQKPHLFYHFFANKASSGFYLAPERLSTYSEQLLTNYSRIEVKSRDDDVGLDLKICDLFSLGCIIAFIYLNGNNLFTLDSIEKYITGDSNEFNIDKILSEIKDNNIITLIKGLLDLDPKKRLVAYANFFLKLNNEKLENNPYLIFKKINDIFLLEPPLPFDQIVNTIKPKTIGMKVILFNYFASRVINFSDLDELLTNTEFILKYSYSFDDEAKISRVIPLLLQLMSVNAISVRRSALFGILGIFKTIKSIPGDYLNILKNNLKSQFQNTILSPSSTLNDSILAAEFIPDFAWEIHRLQPEFIESLLFTFQSIISSKNISIFKVFSVKICQITKFTDYSFFSSILFFLLSAINSSPAIQIEVIKIILEYYRYAKDDEKQYYSDEFFNFLPSLYLILDKCQERSSQSETNSEASASSAFNSNDQTIFNPPNNISTPNKNGSNSNLIYNPKLDEDLICLILELFITVMENKIVPRTFSYSLVNKTLPFLYYPKAKVRFLIGKTLKYYTPLSLNGPLLHFAFDKIKIQPEYRPAIQKRRTFSTMETHRSFVEYKKHPNINPKFLASTRLSNEKITSICVTNNVCLCVSDYSKIRWIITEKGIMKQAKFETRDPQNKIIDIGYINNKIILIYRKGKIEIIENEKSKLVQSKPLFRDFVTCFCPFPNKGIFAFGNFSGSISFIDMRETKVPEKTPFKMNGLVSLTTNPNNETFCYAGFNNGVIVTLDMRMLLPISMSLSIPAYQVLPVATQSNNISLAVCDRSRIQVIEEGSNKIICNFGSEYLIGASQNGGVVLVDNYSASYVDFINKANCYKLYDCDKLPLSLNAPSIFEELSQDSIMKPSVHQHLNQITALNHIDDTFITGDAAGFLNIWSIGTINSQII